MAIFEIKIQGESERDQSFVDVHGCCLYTRITEFNAFIFGLKPKMKNKNFCHDLGIIFMEYFMFL